jgi:hypothetical protein
MIDQRAALLAHRCQLGVENIIHAVDAFTHQAGGREHLLA